MRYSQSISIFHDRPLPEGNNALAGYSALIYAFKLKVPLPVKLSAISSKHKRYVTPDWMMLTPRHAPDDSLSGHLTFALKYEGVDLSILRALYTVIDPKEIIKIVKSEPTGQYSRRLWFLYEWLMGITLTMPDLKSGNFVDVLDQKLQYPGPSRPSRRHRVRNNLPGVREFCALVRRTPKLDSLIGVNLSKKIGITAGKVHPDLLSRAAAFLLLKDSKASFAIEGETPGQTRAERWGKAIGQAGQRPLSDPELARLQKIVITDTRFTTLGYRKEGGFVGMHDRTSGQPIPDHISARPKDINSLMNGLIETNKLLNNSDFDPVLCAAIIAFGFVFIHPFEDGNGRLQRYLIHHVLDEKGFAPKGVIFPISSVILTRLDDYRKVLESVSIPRLALIEWESTKKGNIDVTNETIDLYRYFDATQQAEFLYECVQETVEKAFPEEVNFLKRYDQLKTYIASKIDMPDKTVDLLIRFLTQGEGKLSSRAKQNEFKALTPQEVQDFETKCQEVFKD